MSAPLLASRASAWPSPGEVDAELLSYGRERARWLIAVRWWVVAVAAVVLAATTALGILSNATPVWLVLLGAALANGVVEMVRRSREDDLTETLITAQIVLDLVVLSQVLYWGGGSESPFGIFFVFPMAVAGMLLPLRRALALAGLSVFLHGGTLVAEAVGLIAHQSIDLGDHVHHDSEGAVLWHAPEYVVAYILALAVAEVGIAWFVAVLVRRLRETEQRRIEHERVARSRERLARIGTLASGVAHTVRNPLHGLLNCVDMLESRSDREDPDAQELIQLMSEGVARIDTVTRRLLNLTHEDPPHRRMTQPASLVEDAVRFARVAARDRNVPIATDIGHAPSLSLEADRMMEALVNVIENAVQASSAGQKVRVRLRVEVDESGGEAVVIEVTDSGTGIPEAILDRVFDPFFTTKPVGEGSGLGLAIARHAVEAHDGELHVRSREARGTRVRMSVPYAQGEPS